MNQGRKKGHSVSEITRKKISDSMRGKPGRATGYIHSELSKEKMRMAKLGKKHSEKHNLKISQSLIGNKQTAGKSLSKEHKDKIRIANSLQKAYQWKGEKAGYEAKHREINKYYGKSSKCENLKCIYKNPKRYEWANISNKYFRRRDDYLQLCPSCHRLWDLGKIEINGIKKHHVKTH